MSLKTPRPEHYKDIILYFKPKVDINFAETFGKAFEFKILENHHNQNAFIYRVPEKSYEGVLETLKNNYSEILVDAQPFTSKQEKRKGYIEDILIEIEDLKDVSKLDQKEYLKRINTVIEYLKNMTDLYDSKVSSRKVHRKFAKKKK